MTETAIALLFGHLVADFLLQSDAMVRDKRRARVLLGHGAIVGVTAWIALGLPPSPLPILGLAAAHVAIDWLKLRIGGPAFRAFILDQAAHLATIAAVAALWPGLWASGLFTMPATREALPGLDALPAALAVGSGLVATVWAGGHAVGALMRGLSPATDPEADTSLPQGGRLIGQLERFIILVLVLTGETVGIGFLIAAKSILRFGEIQNARDRHVAEYVIIGTLASFGWALSVALATTWILARL